VRNGTAAHEGDLLIPLDSRFLCHLLCHDLGWLVRLLNTLHCNITALNCFLAFASSANHLSLYNVQVFISWRWVILIFLWLRAGFNVHTFLCWGVFDLGRTHDGWQNCACIHSNYIVHVTSYLSPVGFGTGIQWRFYTLLYYLQYAMKTRDIVPTVIFIWKNLKFVLWIYIYIDEAYTMWTKVIEVDKKITATVQSIPTPAGAWPRWSGSAQTHSWSPPAHACPCWHGPTHACIAMFACVTPWHWRNCATRFGKTVGKPVPMPNPHPQAFGHL